MMDGMYERGTSNTGRPTVLRLTTFKPSLQPPPSSPANASTEHEMPSGDQKNDTIQTPNGPTTKQLAATSTGAGSSVSVVSTVASAVLERLQPDLLPLMMSSGSSAVDDTVISTLTSSPDDLP